ncbi:MAG: DUF4290 domain-containing protein [Sphingobacteriales bacterium]|nr:MAG: DUF4290 domain-containing protein [Sphingobacteriales bacterium]TAF78505.1 MAG: DUF4290 domain-containing protein [Sphingobacteriales bacterium]
MIAISPKTFDYNTSREKLIAAEYGRNVQNMVHYICALPTKEERNSYAQVVIDMMGFLNPHLRDVPDFKHKLWDHLHIISDFKIDVDSQYPLPSKEALHFKPKPLAYPQNRIKFKHYGHTVEMMIKQAKEITEPDRKNHMVNAIANFMKIAYIAWNKDFVTDDQIISDLHALSNGELDTSNVVFNKIDVKPPVINHPRNTKSNNKGRNNNFNKNGSNGNNRNKNNYSNGGSKKSY